MCLYLHIKQLLAMIKDILKNKKNNPIKDKLPVSEKQTWKTRRVLPVDIESLNKMANIKDRIYYLALCGWRIEVEARGGLDYLYAIRYIDRKKRRIYIGKHIDEDVTS